MMLICNSFELVSHKCHNVYFVPSAQVFVAHSTMDKEAVCKMCVHKCCVQYTVLFGAHRRMHNVFGADSRVRNIFSAHSAHSKVHNGRWHFRL